MSMDGRIAGPGGNLDFLGTIDAGDQTDAPNGFARFLATVDSIVVGATTMRWLLDGGHGWPHHDIPTWLLSHDADLVRRIGDTRQPVNRCEGDVDAVFAAIDNAGRERVWLCGGGDIAAQALAADRIDEVVVTIAPAVLGSGTALFDGGHIPSRAFQLTQCVPAGSAAALTWVRRR
jgi:dihydrofolate reductase